MSGETPLERLRREVDADPIARAAYLDACARSELLFELVNTRLRTGLTSAQIAERMGCDEVAVDDLEVGDADPRLSALQRYARAVGLKLEIRVVAPNPVDEFNESSVRASIAKARAASADPVVTTVDHPTDCRCGGRLRPAGLGHAGYICDTCHAQYGTDA